MTSRRGHRQRLPVSVDSRLDGRHVPGPIQLRTWKAGRHQQRRRDRGELVAADAPRTVEVPDDLRTALDGSANATAKWGSLAYSRRKGNSSVPSRTRRNPKHAHGASPP